MRFCCSLCCSNPTSFWTSDFSQLSVSIFIALPYPQHKLSHTATLTHSVIRFISSKNYHSNKTAKQPSRISCLVTKETRDFIYFAIISFSPPPSSGLSLMLSSSYFLGWSRTALDFNLVIWLNSLITSDLIPNPWPLDVLLRNHSAIVLKHHAAQESPGECF